VTWQCGEPDYGSNSITQYPSHFRHQGNKVTRNVLYEAHIHPAIRATIANDNADIVAEIKAAIASNQVVVVGMAQNPFPKKARRALDTAKVPYTYLEYGSYLSGWRRRTALKMWTGWPSFSMIFVKGVLIGGASDLQQLIASGELSKMLNSEP
jgi:monothiol glutaredoxin